MNNNNQFELVHIQELSSIFNREVLIDKEMLRSCSLAYLIIFQHQKNNESVGLHVSIRYLTRNDKLLMQEGATFIAKLDNWMNTSHEEEALKKNAQVQAFIEYGLAFVSGMVFRKVSGTVMNNIFVPYISINEIIEDVVIEEVHKSKEKKELTSIN